MGSEFLPQKFTAEKTETVFLCGCKETKNSPFCDGSHQNMTTPKIVKKSFLADVQPDDIAIDIGEEESILTASLRNNISHLSACGGTGKCSTCRVEIIDGLENCYPRNNLEQKLATKLNLPNNIRLGCQTRLRGDVKYKRLLLDKRDVELNNQVSEQKLEAVGTLQLDNFILRHQRLYSLLRILSAYDVIFILNRYISIMREVIIQHGGEINNYIGDAILAIFGLKESKQQALRAVSAGLEMTRAMDDFKSYLKMAYGRDFDIQVGTITARLSRVRLVLERTKK